MANAMIMVLGGGGGEQVSDMKLGICLLDILYYFLFGI